MNANRATHDTFEVYCRERWSMSRPKAYRLMDAAQIADNLSPMGDNPSPVNERQLRPLASLSPEDQRTVWEQAVEENETVVDANHARTRVDRCQQAGLVALWQRFS
jgi:hypothetical protein